MRDQCRRTGGRQCARRCDRRSVRPPAVHARPHLRQTGNGDMTMSQTATRDGVTIVTQTRVRASREDEFAKWQQQIGAAASEFPGFIEQTVMPPKPPAQIDWVILQRFATLEAATSWLNSTERLALIK